MMAKKKPFCTRLSKPRPIKPDTCTCHWSDAIILASINHMQTCTMANEPEWFDLMCDLSALFVETS